MVALAIPQDLVWLPRPQSSPIKSPYLFGGPNEVSYIDGLAGPRKLVRTQ